MAETQVNQKHSRSHSKPQKRNILFPKIFRLLVKQTIAAILCACVVLGMHGYQVQPFSGYADALGQALRYEINLSKIKESGTGVLHWLSNRFSQGTELNDYE